MLCIYILSLIFILEKYIIEIVLIEPIPLAKYVILEASIILLERTGSSPCGENPTIVTGRKERKKKTKKNAPIGG